MSPAPQKPINPWNLPGYKAGQNVTAKVLGPEPGGYSVTLVKDSLPGFLPTEQKLKTGEEVLGQFVCVTNNRILLSSRFSSMSSMGAGGSQSAPSQWQQQQAPVVDGENPQDAAFRVWAQTNPRKFQLKRAIDLIMPPLQAEEAMNFNIGEYDLEWLITDLEGGMRTACVKAICEDRLSRAALLIYKGRCVGCIYGCKSMNEAFPTEQSLQFMLNDLKVTDTKVQVYDLPEAVTLAMSALFMGYPVNRSDDLDAKSYMDYLLGWFTEKGQTACLAIQLPSAAATCLVFVHGGKYIGAFYVEDQHFSEDINYVYGLLEKDPSATVEASILPPELTSNAVRFGYSLSMYSKAQP
ncbi:MAG: hypothetical protein K2Y22_00030 [Candidatus Obscuribacterales bacterium]|nr:hypothetical protein [Candidatus Obscuribacterales bacterium]